MATQLEQAVQNLRQNAHTITELKQQAKRSEQQADKLEKSLTQAQNELLRRDREISELRLQISTTASSDHMMSHDGMDSGGSQQRALQVAQETIEQLKVVVKFHSHHFLSF